MTMQARQEQVEEVRQWERDWRESITGQVRDVAKITGDVAGVVKEMQGDVKQLMEWKADVQKRKEDGIEKAPDERRANLAIFISAGMLVIYLLGDVLSYFAAHYKP